MNAEALDFWNRAQRALHTAETILNEDPDSSASRSYYAVFHAVSAYFSLQGKTFTKHSALESAVHKELVKPGIWTLEMGKDFSWLVATRSTGDYGGRIHVTEDDARSAVLKATKILEIVRITGNFTA